ncbi:MAG: heavy metal translocating P-type ATPase [Oscillospiraceae bacterium]|nr:heavy metal translocating P-type ATPase [Oscillospiraceae bacterium]
MTKKQKKLLTRVIIGCVLFAAVYITQKLSDLNQYIYLAMYLVPYFVTGWDVLYKCVKGIIRGDFLDEAFLMSLATVGALIIGDYPESVFVMVFYQVGELFQSLAVERSRRSISALMDIRPDSATVLRDGVEEEMLPEEVCPGDTIVVRPGEKIPVDGSVLDGTSALDTKALTGESVPMDVKPGDKVVSGSINMSGILKITAEKSYGESSVAKILELVENSSLNKAKSENFITKFAKYYTPAVVIGALILATIPSIITKDPKTWISRALIFLVVSCPCALVISVPLSFFGGIGGASAKGILIKGANFLEALNNTQTVVFDKTGTLTTGTFTVTEVLPSNGFTKETLLKYSSSAEYYSNHPIAVSLKAAASGSASEPQDTKEISGFGIDASVDGKRVLCGNHKLMDSNGIKYERLSKGGTVVYTAVDGVYAGAAVIEDTVKPTSAEALRALKAEGVTKTVMLTGDRKEAAEAVNAKLGLSEIHYELLPEDKVRVMDGICKSKDKKSTVVFVGDGINDAPVLTRADVGIAMGALGSDAAIEAADMVIMDDDPAKIATAIKISRKTRRIVTENVVFALSVKFAVLILAAFGLTNMWIGVLADVGVAVLAILNAMRNLKVK